MTRTLWPEWVKEGRGSGWLTASQTSCAAGATVPWIVRLAFICSASLIAACQLVANPASVPPEVDEAPSPAEVDQPHDTSNSQPAADSVAGCVLELDSVKPDALQVQLGCGPTYQYRNASPLRGIVTGTGSPSAWGSFCPDSLENRRILHDRGKRGYVSGYCESCLCVPTGQIFVFWQFADGPTCPSGCIPTPPLL